MVNGLEEISQIITTVGFPIMAYIMMFNHNKEMQHAHKTEMESIRETLEKNTLVLQQLVDKLERED